jgi:serine/threonine protein kinase/predicted TPR repeat methyltransferase
MALNFLRLFQSTDPDKPLAGHYKIIEELGAGGFGKTFLAQDLHLPGQPLCVIKQLKPQVTDAESLQTARRLFDTEAKVLYRLGNHDQIPRLLAHFEENEEFYLAQDYIEGTLLSEELNTKQRWSENRTVALLRDILRALAFVHEQNVIHRDLKPSNLIRRRLDGKIVLIDFGAVKQVSTQLVNSHGGATNMTISIGTQGYMPKEQLGGNPRFSSDVYAVGTIGIQALTGTHPRFLSEDPQTGELNWRDRVLSLTPELGEVLDKMVRYDFRTRYATAAQALEAVESLPPSLLEFESPPQSMPASAPERERSPDAESEAMGETVPLPPQVAPSPQNSPTGNSATSTVVVGGHQRPQPPRASAPTTSWPDWIQRYSPWSIVGMVAAVGILLLIFRAVLTPEPTGQFSASDNTPTENSAANGSGSGDPASLVNEANRAREAENYREAIAAYDQAIALDSELAEAHWGRCYSLNYIGQPEEAIAACDRALALKPDYPQALWSKGTAFDRQENYEQALEFYNQALEVDPNFAPAWNNRAVALMNLARDPNEALAALDKATSIDPDLADAWANRGAVLWELRRYDEAIASLEKALAIDPDHPNANDLRQQARQQIGR